MATAPVPTRPPRVAMPAQPPAQQSAAPPAIRKAGALELPPRIVINAVEGFGKTTIGAHTPRPVFIVAKGETGVDTLRNHGLIPDVDTYDPCETWQQVLAAVESLIAADSGYGTLVFDAMGGMERLCHEFVCETEFDGQWGEKGFNAYQKGYDQSVTPWLNLLSRLDRLRNVRRMMVLILSHSKVSTFKNPMGADYDRYNADCHPKTWSVTHKWSDAVLFGKFRTVIADEKKQSGKDFGKGKGIGGTDRVIYTQHTDAYDAKNRFGMPGEIDLPDDPSKSWTTIYNAIGGKENV